MHNLDMSNNRANIAFAGSRQSVWHRLGQERMGGKTTAEWIAAAGLNWSATLVPATIRYPEDFPVRELAGQVHDMDGRFVNLRSDNGFCLSDTMLASDRYENVQPAEVVDFCDHFVSVDERFSFDVIGSLDNGRRIWCLAKYNGDFNIGGDAHQAWLLMSTTFDGSGATSAQSTATRVVCENTFRIANADNSAQVKVRHNTRFDADKARKQLAALAQSVDKYKAIGDAMAQNEMASAETSNLFKTLLGIPFDAKAEDVSTRKMNMFSDLSNAYSSTVAEGTEANTAWTAFQAVTRYCDHDRTTRGSDGTAAGRLEAQVSSNFFGSGDNLKGKAMDLLLPRIREKVLVNA